MRRWGTERLSNLAKATQLVKVARLGQKLKQSGSQVQVLKNHKVQAALQVISLRSNWDRTQLSCRPLSHPLSRDSPTSSYEEPFPCSEWALVPLPTAPHPPVAVLPANSCPQYSSFPSFPSHTHLKPHGAELTCYFGIMQCVLMRLQGEINLRPVAVKQVVIWSCQNERKKPWAKWQVI